MRLVTTDFGLGMTDPMVPVCECLGSEETGDGETVTWRSVLPPAGDESVFALPPTIRIDATVQLIADLSDLDDAWDVRLSADEHGTEVSVHASGPPGWLQDLTPASVQGLGARAQEATALTWAAWHAVGHAHSHEHALGILWLVAAGHDWHEALSLAASVVAV